MNEFKQAAENAADEVIDQMENDNFDPEYVQFIIAKHFAPLAEQFELLVELAKTYKRWLHIKVMFDEGEVAPENIHNLSSEQDECWKRLAQIYANPLIAPLLAAKEEK